ncbi:CoA transferase subunit A [Enterococcus sp. AZ109]|uniref:CoA transferase subunit A n=1 Tax=Enterococcus sp. AZ109 TaxID=2774634 RepID=UPI003F26E5E3
MKKITEEKFINMVDDGMTIMIGGFMSNGAPKRIIEALIKSGKKNFKLISNDTGLVNDGIGRLVREGRLQSVTASHIGLNPETAEQMNQNEISVTLVPQGTLIEQIRAAGYGLGGVLTPTGIGTEVGIGKRVIDVDGESYLLEKPLKADLALIYASAADFKGNLSYKGTTQNFNPVMATAADIVVVETPNYKTTKCIDPDNVITPGIFVDYIFEES